MSSRLNGIILDVIVPVLQPMARFVLPSESAIAKRLQKEWPELTTRLGLRKATRCKWDSEELQRRSGLVRKCRDLLLAKEFTKTLAHRLKKVGPEKPDLLPEKPIQDQPEDISTEDSAGASVEVSDSDSG